MTAAVTSAAAMPVVVAALTGRGVMDVPNHRSSHSLPIPRGAGIACAAGCCTAFALTSSSRRAALRVTGPLALAAVGFADDRRGLPARQRLAAQAAIGAAMGWSAFRTWPAVALSAALTPAIVNATNFMDGINGISAETAIVWGWLLHRNVSMPEAAVTAGVAVGAFAAFLPWNVPRARIFLGDSGSYLLGALFTRGILLAAQSGDWNRTLLAASPLAVYGADTAWALTKRAARGEPLTTAHREHVYQRLVHDHGLPHTAVASLCAGVSALVTVAARRRRTAPLALLLVATYLALPELASALKQPMTKAGARS